MHKLILDLIVFLHIIFVLFVILVPFIGNTYFLFIHSITVPFMMLHWYINDNTCALTLFEKALRQQIYGYVSDSDCITHKLIAPVYDFKNNYESESNLIYSITTILWLISVGRLMQKYKSGEIKSFLDLCKM